MGRANGKMHIQGANRESRNWGYHLGQGDIHTHWVSCKADVANNVRDLAIPESEI